RSLGLVIAQNARAFAVSFERFSRLEVEARCGVRKKPGALKEFGFVMNRQKPKIGPFGPFIFAGWLRISSFCSATCRG
ncbi:MAG TPA: hypothetical protein VGG62_11475, partial [Terracidiphilus sp.]